MLFEEGHIYPISRGATQSRTPTKVPKKALLRGIVK